METNAIVAERRITRALNKRLLQYAENQFRIEEQALVYSEKADKWIGPFPVINVEGRMVTVKAIEGLQKFLFNAFQLKPYWTDINGQYLQNFEESNIFIIL